MSERGNFRGGRGGNRGGRGGESRGGRGGGRGGGAAGAGGGDKEKPKKENIIDLNRFLDRELRVKFNGGREVVGTLKGFDQLMNLVLDDVKEVMRGKFSHFFVAILWVRG
jgi:U6 snRNA-associated Sm-like protein LSm7